MVGVGVKVSMGFRMIARSIDNLLRMNELMSKKQKRPIRRYALLAVFVTSVSVRKKSDVFNYSHSIDAGGLVEMS